jgi:hypothetical protein
MQRNLSSISSSAASPSPLSPADGFLCVKDGVDEMIKYVANEPSVGLYFVQQHAQASMPLLLDVKVHGLPISISSLSLMFYRYRAFDSFAHAALRVGIEMLY